MEKKVTAVLFLNGLGLILEVHELALKLVPNGKIVDIVECDDGVENEYEHLEIDQGRQEYLL